MLTIGRLARYVGVSVKTIRVYHAKGLLPEPRRDASGYRRYTADDAVELIRIRTLAEAGVPLARIRELRSSGDAEFRRAVGTIGDDLADRIRALQATQDRLRGLAEGRLDPLPPRVGAHLERLAGWGFTPSWVDLQRDLWILVFATHPDHAAALFDDQAETLSDPELRGLFLAYDRARDLAADDPRLNDLAARVVAATHRRYAATDPPELDRPSDIPALVQDTVNAASPAWRRLDTLIRAGLAAGAA